MRFLKIGGGVLGVAVVLVLAAIAFVTSRTGGDFIKARLAGAMLEQKQRALKIDGPLELSLWPTLGLKLGGLTLSEPGGEREFAAIDSARIAVALRPLLSNQVSVDAFEAAGIRANLVRHKDGTLNIDDFFPQEKTPSAPLQIDIAAIKLDAVRLTWHDEGSGSTTQLPGVSLVSGRIQADTGRGTFRADSLSASLAEAQDQWNGKLLLPSVEASAEALTLDKFSGDLTVTLPQMRGKRLRVPFEGQLRLDRKKQTGGGRLQATLGQSKLVLKFETIRFAPISLGFDLDVDSLNLDDYLPEKQADAKDGDGTFDLSFLQEFDVHGTVRIGSLQAAKVKATGLRFRITAAKGKLDIAPIVTGGGKGK